MWCTTSFMSAVCLLVMVQQTTPAPLRQDFQTKVDEQADVEKVLWERNSEDFTNKNTLEARSTHGNSNDMVSTNEYDVRQMNAKNIVIEQLRNGYAKRSSIADDKNVTAEAIERNYIDTNRNVESMRLISREITRKTSVGAVAAENVKVDAFKSVDSMAGESDDNAEVVSETVLINADDKAANTNTGERSEDENINTIDIYEPEGSAVVTDKSSTLLTSGNGAIASPIYVKYDVEKEDLGVANDKQTEIMGENLEQKVLEIKAAITTIESVKTKKADNDKTSNGKENTDRADGKDASGKNAILQVITTETLHLPIDKKTYATLSHEHESMDSEQVPQNASQTVVTTDNYEVTTEENIEYIPLTPVQIVAVVLLTIVGCLWVLSIILTVVYFIFIDDDDDDCSGICIKVCAAATCQIFCIVCCASDFVGCCVLKICCIACCLVDVDDE